MGNNYKLCIHCASGECRWRDGIMCMSWVCARDSQESGNDTQSNNGSLDSLFSIFGIKPGDPTYDSLMKGFGK